MRAFLALPLPEDICDRLETVQKDLRFGRRTEREDFHITLAFLGDRLSEAQAEAAHDAMTQLSAPAPSIWLDGLDLFGGGTVLAALVAPDAGLEILHRKIRSLLHGAGLMVPRERFRPHVTIARFSGPADGATLAPLLNRHAAFGTAAFSPRELVFYQSSLGPKRATYRALAEYPLG